MSEAYRITVRGVLSERFCRGFCGLSRQVEADRTVLAGDPVTCPPLANVIAALGNLGLEIIAVDPPSGAPEHTTTEA